MKIFLVAFFIVISIPLTAFATDMTNGVWKNLDEKYQQNIDNPNLLSGFVSNKIYYNDTYSSNNRQNEYSDTYLNTRVGLNLQIYKNLFVKSVIRLERALQASEDVRRSQLSTGGGDKSFENEGAYLGELVLNYNYQNFSALAGKFTANFGDAWKRGNGIWVNELARNYEENEKLGLGFIQRAGDKKTIGEYVFGLSAFTNDRKNFDNSIITKRDSATKSQGLPGDTRNLQSYVASMDIYYDFTQKETLSYHFAYSNLAVDERQNTSNIPALLGDQKSLAVNMNYAYPVSDKFLVNGFIEYVNVKNLGGNTLASDNFLTINLTSYIFNDFSLTLARATEKQKSFGTNGVDKYIDEISFGYKFDSLNPILKGFSMAAGYNQRETDDRTNPVTMRSAGFLLKHKMEF